MNPVKHEIPDYIAKIIRECVEVRLPSPDNFLKVKETLTRMGVASKRDSTLFQSCHILHKQGHYYIVHFKELFLLDGKASQTVFDDADRQRRNLIVSLLEKWGLVEVVDPSRISNDVSEDVPVTIIPFHLKSSWKLVSKYEIGKKRN